MSIENNEQLQSLRSRIFTEPTTSEVKPALVEYIKQLVHNAQELTGDQLLGGHGHKIAMDIAGALSFQGAKGVKGEDWITETNEPVLYQILNLSGALDANASNADAWKQLFEVVDSF